MKVDKKSRLFIFGQKKMNRAKITYLDQTSMSQETLWVLIRQFLLIPTSLARVTCSTLLLSRASNPALNSAASAAAVGYPHCSSKVSDYRCYSMTVELGEAYSYLINLGGQSCSWRKPHHPYSCCYITQIPYL